MDARTLAKLAQENGISIIEMLEAMLEYEKYGGKSEKLETNAETSFKIITRILREIGTPMSLLGYEYLREAILYCVDTKSRSMTKEIHPHVATKFNTTINRVERAIRHLIESTEKEGNEKIEKYFGLSKYKFTNSQFIFGIADYIKAYIL